MINRLRSKKPIPKSNFINAWKSSYKLRAGLIWEELKNIKVLDKNNRVTGLVFEISNFLKSLHLQYNNVIEALYAIANDVNFQENLTNTVENVIIYRQERTIKTWKESSIVVNDDPQGDDFCTKLWDVSIYDDLSAHRNTENEEKSNQNSKLNYDHIPSADAIRRRGISRQADIKIEINILQEIIKGTNDNIARQQLKSSSKYGVRTRRQLPIPTTNATIEFIKKDIEKLKREKSQIKIEINGHGWYWWTIAIPEKLHQQGSTFLQSSAAQQKSTVHPFLNDINVYLSMLTMRSEEFISDPDEFLRALGAFRYLYRCQVKSPIPIAGEYTISCLPQGFFKKLEDKKSIDKLFHDHIVGFMEKREGFTLK